MFSRLYSPFFSFLYILLWISQLTLYTFERSRHYTSFFLKKYFFHVRTLYSKYVLTYIFGLIPSIVTITRWGKH